MGNGAMKHCHDVKVETIADMGFAEKEVRAALSKPGRDVIPTRYKRGGNLSTGLKLEMAFLGR